MWQVSVCWLGGKEKGSDIKYEKGAEKREPDIKYERKAYDVKYKKRNAVMDG